VLKNSLRVRFHPRLGTKYADFGALLARFVVAMSSVLTFSTGCPLPRTRVNKAARRAEAASTPACRRSL
jgi:hypothetical protein